MKNTRIKEKRKEVRAEDNSLITQGIFSRGYRWTSETGSRRGPDGVPTDGNGQSLRRFRRFQMLCSPLLSRHRTQVDSLAVNKA